VHYLWVIGITKVSDSKSNLHTHSRSCAIMPFDSSYMISYLSSVVTMPLSCTVSKILSVISENLKTSHPFKGQFVIPMLNRHLVNHCTKFDVSSFSHSWDMDGAPQIFNNSRDVTTPLSGTVCRPYAGTIYDRPVYQIWNIYIDPQQRYEKRQKMQKFGWFRKTEIIIWQSLQQNITRC